MIDLTDKQLEDMILHELFKRFLDSERKNYNLSKWVWVNERQDGSRLKDSSKAREVLHYHCLFSYTTGIDYREVNMRWLSLLYRNHFEIFNSRFTDKAKRAEIINELKACKKNKYDYFLKNWDNFYLVNKKPENIRKHQLVRVKGEQTYGRVFEVKNTVVTVRYRTMNDAVVDRKIYTKDLERKENFFLSPLQVDKRQIGDIDKLSKYLAAYLTKDEQDKVFCRRWGATQGLSLKKDQVTAFFAELAPQEAVYVDYETGEVTALIDLEKLLPYYELSGVQAFENVIEISDRQNNRINRYKTYYYPPAWLYWRQSEDFSSLFYKHFKINIK